MDCCKLGGSQYLNKDRTIDSLKLFIAKTEYRNWEFSQFGNIVSTMDLNDPVCKCPCHVIGSSIMH